MNLYVLLTVEEKKDMIGWRLSWCHSLMLQSALQLRKASDKNGDHCMRYTGPYMKTSVLDTYISALLAKHKCVLEHISTDAPSLN